MALHQSLVDVSDLAPRASSPATARGLTAEALDVLRNAVAHRDDEAELAAWFSRFIRDIAHSPGVRAGVVFTGAAARGDLLPTMPVLWLGEDKALRELLADVGLNGQAVSPSAAYRVDAGEDPGAGGESQLLRAALEERPAPLRLVDGLPDKAAAVNVQHLLLSPIAAVARWAAPAPQPTVDRLAIGVERGLITRAEQEALTLAWRTALALEMRRWYAGIELGGGTLADLPPLDRTAYGSASRSLSAVFEAIAARST